MSKNISIAAVSSVVIALSMQVNAGGKIDFKSTDSDHWADKVNAAIGSKESREAVINSMFALTSGISVDGVESEIDVEVILQNLSDSTNSIGSTSKPGYNYNGVTHCYGNCHSACHGSRSWR